MVGIEFGIGRSGGVSSLFFFVVVVVVVVVFFWFGGGGGGGGVCCGAVRATGMVSRWNYGSAQRMFGYLFFS